MSKQVPAKNGGTLTRPEKGETMNPKGRPEGAKNRSTILKEILALKDETGKTKEYLVNNALIEQAIKGNINAIREVFDTLFGKLTESHEVNQTNELSPEILNLLQKYLELKKNGK